MATASRALNGLSSVTAKTRAKIEAAAAELNRTPFDLMEAESELVAGFHTEYTGMKFGIFYVSEWAAGLAWSAVIVTLFLSGWRVPFLSTDPPPILAATVISRMSRVNTFPRLASSTAFLRLICDHLE